MVCPAETPEVKQPGKAELTAKSLKSFSFTDPLPGCVTGSRCGSGEEPGSHGLHLCGFSTVTHPGVFGGVEYGELGGDLTCCHRRVSRCSFIEYLLSSVLPFHTNKLVSNRPAGGSKKSSSSTVLALAATSLINNRTSKLDFLCPDCSHDLCLFLSFSATKIFVNGCWVGIHKDPEQLMNTLRKLRRQMDIIVSEVTKPPDKHPSFFDVLMTTRSLGVELLSVLNPAGVDDQRHQGA